MENVEARDINFDDSEDWWIPEHQGVAIGRNHDDDHPAIFVLHLESAQVREGLDPELTTHRYIFDTDRACGMIAHFSFALWKAGVPDELATALINQSVDKLQKASQS